MIERLARILNENSRHDGVTETEVPRLHILRSVTPTEAIPILHKPAVCFVAQGRKQTTLADHSYLYEPSKFLIVSVDLPISGQILDASPDKPYLCLRLDLEPAAIADVISAAVPGGLRNEEPQRGIAVSDVPTQLLDAVVRFAELLESGRESDRAVLAPLAEREILYRLLLGEQGDRLRQIAMAESKLSQINKAISIIKKNFDKALKIEEIAAQVNMSVSSFHQHFKTVTAMSPLQYQKQIRLQEARWLMIAQALDAATAGFNVGYESPSQFSREYARMFGLPPKKDIEKMKSMPATTWQ
ncbi:AraC family transcriptional regulator [Rhizobium bangladeshense]|uniref:AraC family transcriptional regulator n=1 Tax=Rhizobium bangladeshense TaxID=1138189 RepID=UPI001A993EE5|nr:AraC family transcriptional regulator [Rhizobium bangladeshense]MBX4870755.1 AraC family transcriptional regulator [Rhizobium bangladeshense]MBX4889957.1 AraC family transcriptional regulator [Rhizobium bangladeshense]MBX4920816.1 AraC family transcriptional regulator [Rhizobium bangladeshense]MBX4931431.1 AraC family transcriptional regulator [Rhizobium bangladeshense]MBY3582362.1 AraC family transcriptional regulator [Rhizobium bangladeshense]